jgi:hypothetical protein
MDGILDTSDISPSGRMDQNSMSIGSPLTVEFAWSYTRVRMAAQVVKDDIAEHRCL